MGDSDSGGGDLLLRVRNPHSSTSSSSSSISTSTSSSSSSHLRPHPSTGSGSGSGSGPMSSPLFRILLLTAVFILGYWCGGGTGSHPAITAYTARYGYGAGAGAGAGSNPSAGGAAAGATTQAEKQIQTQIQPQIQTQAVLSVDGASVQCGYWSGDELLRWFRAHTTGRKTWKWLHYFDFYEENFGWVRSLYRCHQHQFSVNRATSTQIPPQKPTRPLRMIEIGTRDGGSLEMWKYYFNTNHGKNTDNTGIPNDMELIGIDINPYAKQYTDPSASTRMFIGSQNNVTFLNEIVSTLGIGTIDIILDDASHAPSDQEASFSVLHQLLSENSIYMVEDLKQSAAVSPYLKHMYQIADKLTSYDNNNDKSVTKTYAVKAYKNVAVLQKRTQAFVEPIHAIKMGDWEIQECPFAAC